MPGHNSQGKILWLLLLTGRHEEWPRSPGLKFLSATFSIIEYVPTKFFPKSIFLHDVDYKCHKISIVANNVLKLQCRRNDLHGVENEYNEHSTAVNDVFMESSFVSYVIKNDMLTEGPSMSHVMSQINASAVQTKSSVVPHIDIDEFSQPAFLLPGHKVKCVTLNVSGLHNKLKHGILDQYLANFHIISLVETNTDSPGLKDSILNNFTCIAKKKIKQNSRYKYGGIHGICTIVSPEFKDKTMAIPETESECTLWLKLKLSEKDECILGVVYMPCETSRFYDEEMFSQIENDIVTLKARYKIPICLSGDFNAHTGQDDDFINPDDFLADITGCNMLGEEIMKSCNELNPNFTCYRYSQDKAEVNRNGKQLLSLCQGLNLKIVNGRLGSDKYLGGSTCQKTNGSVIDYVIVCEDMLPYVSDFIVLKCLTPVCRMSIAHLNLYWSSIIVMKRLATKNALKRIGVF